MKKLSLLFILMIFAIAAKAQTDKIAGHWLTTRVTTSDTTRAVYQTTDFNDDGTMVVIGIPVGHWKYQEKGNKLVLTSDMIKDFNGAADIVTLTDDELVIRKEGTQIFYVRLHPEQIAQSNRASHLRGVWKARTDEGETSFMRFELPDHFAAVTTFDGGTSTAGGTWLYHPTDKTLILVTNLHAVKGKNKMLTQQPDILKWENNGKVLVATRVESDTSKIYKLNFSEEDFDEEEDQSDSLPLGWRDPEEMRIALAKVKQLTYRRGVWLNKVKAFDNSTTIARIATNVQNSPIVFTYFLVTDGDTTQYGERVKDDFSQNDNPFFPLDMPDYFRVAGSETITVPAGTFKCTVVEGGMFADEKKIKYWLIDDKPGVYARMVTAGDSFGTPTYEISELQEMK